MDSVWNTFFLSSHEEDATILREFARQADYYLPSREEFLALWHVDTIEAGLLHFKGLPVTVVVKDSANGAFTLESGEVKHVPTFSVTAQNTIGAGDSFNAGFITAREMGQDITSSIRFACATAALKISQPLPPTRELVEELLALHSADATRIS